MRVDFPPATARVPEPIPVIVGGVYYCNEYPENNRGGVRFLVGAGACRTLYDMEGNLIWSTPNVDSIREYMTQHKYEYKPNARMVIE